MDSTRRSSSGTYGIGYRRRRPHGFSIERAIWLHGRPIGRHDPGRNAEDRARYVGRRRTIRPSSAVSSERWPMVRWRRSTIDRGLAGRRRSPPRPRHRLSTSPAARPRTSASHGSPHRKKRCVFPVGQQHPRSVDPARRFASRAGNRAQSRQILLANRQFDRPPLTRHHLKPRCRIKAARLQAMSGKMNPAHRIGFNESMN